MKLTGVYIDKDSGEFRLFKETKLFGFSSSASPLPEIILTKEEAKARGINYKKYPKGFCVTIQGVKVPLRVE